MSGKRIQPKKRTELNEGDTLRIGGSRNEPANNENKSTDLLIPMEKGEEFLSQDKQNFAPNTHAMLKEVEHSNSDRSPLLKTIHSEQCISASSDRKSSTQSSSGTEISKACP
ncbi:hypothetical protein Nepgr_023644 [Nepenthes gracilis]|uniref:Uncharacterized protein n=1 Tax=Nepenthes gracilis TaxID=150966 RepID=A0AAD3T4M0_NEPGR|nr:hypothetical protein Nepgr_023644 [Nepenthes gracilis]